MLGNGFTMELNPPTLILSQDLTKLFRSALHLGCSCFQPPRWLGLPGCATKTIYLFFNALVMCAPVEHRTFLLPWTRGPTEFNAWTQL